MTTRNFPRLALAAAVCGACGIAASSALAHEGLDISPYVQDGKVVTGAFDDDAGTLSPLERVFLLELEADGDFGVDAPALNLAAGAGFGPNVSLGMDFTSQLFFWNGTGDVSFSPVTNGDRIRVFQGIDTGVFLNGDAPAGDYYWLESNSNGLGHEHAFSQFYGGDSAGLSDVGTVTPGIYYALGQVLDEGGAFAPSDEVALLFNTGGEDLEEAHEAAESFLRANVVPVPEPTSLALLGLGGLALMRRRR